VGEGEDREDFGVGGGGGGDRGLVYKKTKMKVEKMNVVQRKRHGRRRPKENGKMDLLKRIQVHKDPK